MKTDCRLDRIQQRLEPFRNTLLKHPIYYEISDLNNLHRFMEYHVFAVWDFMSLLKSLQQRICGCNTPWLPFQDGNAARLVNEIVLGEESDEDGQGGFASHFDIYHRAMRRCGADTQNIDRFLNALHRGDSVENSLAICQLPSCIRQFVSETFDVINSKNLCAVASAFTFGREDLLPDVFRRVVDDLNVKTSCDLTDFRYYLTRHIELDDDKHGPMAERLIVSLCGDRDENWRVAEDVAIKSLQSRQALWDGMYQSIRHREASLSET